MSNLSHQPTPPVRTRFAPSPTGFLHIGGARTALFSYAFARRHQGQFILRIEDTDVERSTAASVDAIFDGMRWLSLDYDEGPFFQTQRMARYQAVLADLRAAGAVYPCYSTKEELEQVRALQEAEGKKPRYDRRWRPAPGKILPSPPAGVSPVLRFANPLDGSVVWNDLVKGRIEIANSELDDLIVARSDGTPTYNFCVVVDDWDMQITHVIRGDDHVNNTPRQINILHALGAPLPFYAHLPMILREDGQKMSKRSDAVSVMQYATMGILPEALINYLARLGWSHGDDELFTRAELIAWFDTQHIRASAARFDIQKLKWVNAQYIKQMEVGQLATQLQPLLSARGVTDCTAVPIERVLFLYRERADTLVALADAILFFYKTPTIPASLAEQHLNVEGLAVLQSVAIQLKTVDWQPEAIQAVLKAVAQATALKFAQIATPLRVQIAGVAVTPSIDAVLALLPRDTVLQRLLLI